jgi:hypothetical protein
VRDYEQFVDAMVTSTKTILTDHIPRGASVAVIKRFM